MPTAEAGDALVGLPVMPARPWFRRLVLCALYQPERFGSYGDIRRLKFLCVIRLRSIPWPSKSARTANGAIATLRRTPRSLGYAPTSVLFAPSVLIPSYATSARIAAVGLRLDRSGPRRHVEPVFRCRTSPRPTSGSISNSARGRSEPSRPRFATSRRKRGSPRSTAR